LSFEERFILDTRKQTGQRGEDIAASFLTQRGYRLVARNWRCATGEIDLIMEQDTSLVFVEVRTRRGRKFGSAEESVTPAKQARLVELAQSYLQEVDALARSWRIDVIAIQLGRGMPQINHIENAVGW
jgi:putative endonuclease